MIGGNQVTAADAAGCGTATYPIADSLLFPLPVPHTDGLTWYAAVRIVDNNSAINANTAVDRAAANNSSLGFGSHG